MVVISIPCFIFTHGGVRGIFNGRLIQPVCLFEVLLLASYVLLLHTQGKARFQLGIHYVTINLLASALFLIGLGMIYGSVGSLNMADVARLMPILEPDAHKLAAAGGLLLFVVLELKQPCFPLDFGYRKPMLWPQRPSLQFSPL